MIFPEAQPMLLGWLTFQWPSPLTFLAWLNLAFAWRRGSTTARALSVAIAATVMLHLFAWLAYGTHDGINTLCSVIGLMLILPISLRAKGIFPLIVAASVLLATLSLGCAAVLELSAAQGARTIAGLANLAMLIACWTELTRRRRIDWQAAIARERARAIA